MPELKIENGQWVVVCDGGKALILEKTAEPDRPEMLQRLTHGATYHRPEVLLDRLRDLGIALTPELARRMRRFDWTTGLRYETGRKDTGETNGLLRRGWSPLAIDYRPFRTQESPRWPSPI